MLDLLTNREVYNIKQMMHWYERNFEKPNINAYHVSVSYN